MANKLVRFDPFNELSRLDPFRGAQEWFKDFDIAPLGGLNVEPRIKIDVAESDQAYTVKAEIPGAKKDDIKVEVNGNQVSISAEVNREKEEKKGETMVRSERYYGQQYRSFTLANEINDAESQAKYENGILELVLPKKSGTGGRKLTVN